MKKFISVILFFSLTVGLIPAVSFSTYANKYSSELSFEEYIIAHLENFEKEIDVSEYAAKNNWNENYIADEFARIITDNPRLFFVINSGVVCKVSKKTREVNGVLVSTTFTISNYKYSVEKSEYAAKKKSFDATVKKIVAKVDEKMADWEKALFVHDYLALNVKYDRSLSKYTAYDALVGGSSVCQGYAMAYNCLMRELGIESTMITSDSMNHAWNYVKIGGKWYHVDVTSDDPLLGNTYDLLGKVKHNYFLLSDKAIKKLGSKGWDTKGLPAASSTKYDNYFWKSISSGMFKLEDSWYWIELDKKSPAYNQNYLNLSKEEYNDNFYKMYSLIRRYNVKTNKLATVYRFYSTWFTWGTENKSQKSWSDDIYATLASYDGKLYYNTTKGIYSFDPSSKKAVKVSSPANLNGYIYGMVMKDNKITYTVKQKASEKDTLKVKTIK